MLYKIFCNGWWITTSVLSHSVLTTRTVLSCTVSKLIVCFSKLLILKYISHINHVPTQPVKSHIYLTISCDSNWWTNKTCIWELGINMLIGTTICTLDGVHLAGPNSVHPHGVHHGLHKYIYIYTPRAHLVILTG